VELRQNGKKINLPWQVFSTHCAAGQAGDFAKALFELTV
jgi:hypothetical protein